MKSDYVFYPLSLKVLLKKKGKILILREKDLIDLPGGRIEKREANLSIEEVIRREVKEELGPKVRFILQEPLFFFRAYSTRSKQWVIVIIHKAEYLGGDIILSDEHDSYKWVREKSFRVKQKDFKAKDKEKYLVFKKYFNK